MDYKKIYEQCKEEDLSGRYITNVHIEPLLHKADRSKNVFVAGQSVQQKPIYGVNIGRGKIKVLAWSQMHGNESTASKSIFDLINFLESGSPDALQILSEVTLCVIPILNPDGAELYTRENANGVDLNRDAQLLSQPESRVLRNIYDQLSPDYCFNLHDQRTIFGVGFTGKPATISFLAPSYNEACEINSVRMQAIKVITAMDRVLQTFIPGGVGRFDDSFNINCVGDTFQYLKTPTILIEAGHFGNDYERDITRQFVFFALLSGLNAIHENVLVGNEYEHYMQIPQNNPNLFDFVYKNISLNYDNSEIITNFAAQYIEELVNNRIEFNAFIVKIGDLSTFSGHRTVDGEGRRFRDGMLDRPVEGQRATFMLGDDIKVENGMIASQ